METIEFKKILVKTAVFVMAADGDVHHEELSELKSISESKNYFTELDLEKEINEVLKEIKSVGRYAYINFLKDLKSKELSIPEVLLLFESTLQIIKSDKKITESEVSFFQKLRYIFPQVPEDIFNSRFGTEDLKAEHSDSGFKYDLDMSKIISDSAVLKEKGLKSDDNIQAM